MAERLRGQLGSPTQRPTLRLSQMGPRCPRALWYSIHHPELSEPLPPWTEIKFAFGHIMEAMAIQLATSAGHQVVGAQDELELDGIIGHRDCVIDGCTVDIKSASSITFGKIRSGELERDDSFGYLDQLDGYVLASANDPMVVVKDRGYIFAIDKQLGHMCCHEHRVSEERAAKLRERILQYKEIVNRDDPPPCMCGTIPRSDGNHQLDTKAGYNSHKYECFPHLRAFITAKGPIFLTKVIKLPRDKDGNLYKEIDKQGKVIYNAQPYNLPRVSQELKARWN
jgi:hypothetical protein